MVAGGAPSVLQQEGEKTNTRNLKARPAYKKEKTKNANEGKGTRLNPAKTTGGKTEEQGDWGEQKRQERDGQGCAKRGRNSRT